MTKKDPRVQIIAKLMFDTFEKDGWVGPSHEGEELSLDCVEIDAIVDLEALAANIIKELEVTRT